MLTRDLDRIREAYKRRHPEATRRAYNPSHPHQAEEKHTTTQDKHIKSIRYSGFDGTITTFTAASGVACASLSSGIVLMIRLADLLADGISMSISYYLSSKSETEYEADRRARDEWEVENYPEGEKFELKEIYMSRGVSQKDAKPAIEITAKAKIALVDTMMIDELEIILSDESRLANAIATFISLALSGLNPFSTYVFVLFVPSLDSIRFLFACILILARIIMFILGSLKIILIERTYSRAALKCCWLDVSQLLLPISFV